MLLQDAIGYIHADLWVDICPELHARDKLSSQSLPPGCQSDLVWSSQPTLSMQLKKLEAELNVILFHREGKKVRLTEAGSLLLPKAIHMIETAREMKSLAKTLQDPFCLPVRLGVIPTIAPYFMPLVLPPLTQKLPELNLILIEEKT